MKTAIIFSILLGFVFSATAAENQLTNEQKRAVIKARQFGLPMKLVNISIDGIDRSILVLGETHFKPGETANREMELISNFDSRLIEGYGGTGKKPTFREKALMKFIQVMYPLMKKTQKNGQASTLPRTHERGFLRKLNGYVYYNRCYVGRVTAKGFSLDKTNNQAILSGLSVPHREAYKRELLELVKSSVNVRAETKSDKNFSSPSWTSCPQNAIRADLNTAKTYEIESGDLAKWSNKDVCGDLVCTYSRSGKPSTRELRMAENIYETLKSQPEQKTALVLVGAAHNEGLEHLLKTWDSKNRPQNSETNHRARIANRAR